jgi:small-conductance mechanosensitive channel
MPLSPRESVHKRFSRERYQTIPNDGTNETMAHHPNDATIDIPLEQVPSSGFPPGVRNDNPAFAPLKDEENTNQRQSLFRGRRRGPAGLQKGDVGYDGEEDTITTMGKIYKKILDFSIITRYMLYVAPLALILAIPIIVGGPPITDNPQIGKVRLRWFFVWVEIVWCSLWASKLVAHFLPFIFQMLVGVVNSGIRKYSLVIRSLQIPLSLVGWTVTSLATFLPIMTRNPIRRNLPAPKGVTDWNPTKPDEWENIVQQVLGAFVVASLIFLAEKLIIQLISINYHRKQFTARIKASKHNIFLLSLLYDASRQMFPAYCNEFAEEDATIADQLNLNLGNGKKSHARSGSQTPMRMLQRNVGRVGDKISAAVGNVASEITGKEVFNSNSAHSIVIQALEKRRTSEALARRIWMSFVVEDRDALVQDDFLEVLGSAKRQQAEEAFVAIDNDANGDISLDEMVMAVVEFSRERKSIASSMHDVDQAITVLDRLLCTVVLVAIVFVFIAFLNQSFVTTLATAGTALLSLSFVFAATTQELLGSCIFLFVKHPYDNGDRVDIGVDQFTVEHISLLFTVFRRANGHKVGGLVQIPNISLNTLFIENLSRSHAMMEEYSVFVSFDTTFEDIQILRDELNKFVMDKDNSRDFQPDMNIEILGTTDMGKLEIQVQIKHKGNWANETLRAARRSKFMCALVAALKAVPIYGPGGGLDAAGSAANPGYSVTITDSDAKEAAKLAAKEREQARLFPPVKDEASSIGGASDNRPAGLTSQEARIIGDLNSRSPAADFARDRAFSTGRDDEGAGASLTQIRSRDTHSIDEVRGLLRRGSSRGKRRADNTHAAWAGPSIPTIAESRPTGDSYSDRSIPYQQAAYSSAPDYSYNTSPPSASQAYPYDVQTSYTSPQLQQTQARLPQVQRVGSPIEMAQLGSESNNNPYRSAGAARTGQGYHQPPEVEDDVDGSGAAKPSSGA